MFLEGLAILMNAKSIEKSSNLQSKIQDNVKDMHLFIKTIEMLKVVSVDETKRREAAKEIIKGLNYKI